MPADLERCVDKVKGKKGVDSAYAICNASLNKGTKELTPDTDPKNVNKNRQVPFFNPPVKKGKVEPDIKKKLTGGGANRLNQDSILWKDIFDAQLRNNVKEPKL